MLKLRKTEPSEPLIVAMTAVRMADRLLVIGCAEPKLIAQIALKPGLTGRACAVDEHGDRPAAGVGPEDPVVDWAGGKFDGGHGPSGSV